MSSTETTTQMDYSREAPHSDRLILRAAQPFNAEPPVSALVEFPITPEELIYCRNHGPVEELDEDTYTIKVDGLVERALDLRISTLRTDFAQLEVVAALQCAGNRRAEMAARRPVKGVTWAAGVIANCRWRGPRLRDVLLRAGLAPALLAAAEGAHVCFASHVTPCQDDTYYGGSIPLATALDPEGDVILALDMNGQRLSPDHGAPVRAVVPGTTGARWVKWLDRIAVARAESPSFYQQRDYKVLPPHVADARAAEDGGWWARLDAIQSLPVNAVVGSVTPDVGTPGAGAGPGAGPGPGPGTERLRAKGYAMGAGGRGGRIRRVQVSVDGGSSWHDARLAYQEGLWSWTLWECVVDVAGARAAAAAAGMRELEVLCRAEDESGRVQKRECEWNFRGVAYNAYGRYVWRW